jgi:hypothetical protein
MAMMQTFPNKHFDSSKVKIPVARDLDEEGAASSLAEAKKKLETSRVDFESSQNDLESKRTLLPARLVLFCSS